MNDVIIKVENLSKRYRIGTRDQKYRTFREALIDNITAPIKNLKRLRRLTKFDDKEKNRSAQTKENDVIWALNNVSFEVKQGEVIGIIGRNGAGKTTLLKILTRITEPTSGEVKLYGRVSSLLEVGTGFHPELTGRENIFLNGSILGMRKIEIEHKFAEIVNFAEIEKFIDTPVKRYSSGMYVRLAFAVAAHLDPEILLVDEVLAVGDIEFQKKCLKKMENVAIGGRTVLFVSHNMSAINNLCSRAILLEEGGLKLEGETNKVVSEYISGSTQNDLISQASFKEDYNKPVQIINLAITKEDGSTSPMIEYIERNSLHVDFIVRKSNKDYYVALSIIDIQGNMIFFSSDEDVENSTQLSSLKPGKYIYQIPLPSKLLRPGKYYIRISFNQKTVGPVDQKRNLLSFEIIDSFSYRASANRYRPGSVAPEIVWTIINESDLF